MSWPRVKELFHGALELEPSERASFLDATCGEEQPVREEVERLLAAHRQAGGFIERSPVAMAGRVIGHYKIERALGAGGMGAVYLARDLELGRAVAIKIAIASDEDAKARLKREAQYASHLNHPHICTIHEVGTADDQPFIVMEFVEGQRLSDLIPAQGLPVDDVKRYGMQIADALAHAHHHGVTHRDLKAANIVVTPEGRAKVLDFGLARRVPAETLRDLSESTQSVSEESGMIAGTLACMAPELFRGATPDARSDIWSLGVLLYEMATGTRPFSGATGFELSGAILHEPPAPWPDGVPQSIRTIARRCLEKDPGERYADAEDVRRAIGDASFAGPTRIVPRPAPAARPSFLSRCWRSRLAWAVAVALVLGGAYRLQRHTPEEAPVALGASGRPAIAVLNFEAAGGTDAAWLSQGIPSMLLTGLAQTNGLDLVSTQRLVEAARQQGAPDLKTLEFDKAAQVAKHAGAGAIVTGSVHTNGADIRIDARVEDLASGRILTAQSVRGTDAFALVDQLAARIRDSVGILATPGIRHTTDVSTSSLDAFRLYSIGADAFANFRAPEAARALEQAVQIDPAFAEAYLVLASVAGSTGEPGKRREYLDKAARYADRLSERRRLLLDVQLTREKGNVAATSRALDELIARFPDTEIAYTIAGLHYGSELRETDKQLQIMKTGIAALPASKSVLNNYGYALSEAGRNAEAIRAFERLVELAPREANAYDSLAEGYLRSGSAEKAVELYQRALAVDPTFSGSRVTLTWALAVLGRYDEAMAVRTPLKSEEAFLLSRLGRYKEAATALAAGRQLAERDANVAEQSEYSLIAAVIALERQEYARASDELSLAERAVAGETRFIQRRHGVLINLLRGIADLGTRQLDAARTRLRLLESLHAPGIAEEKFWYRTLEGEVALARGDVPRARAAFAAGEPAKLIPFKMQRGWLPTLVNGLSYRDGAARAAKAQGNLGEAIQLYRRLLVYGPEAKFVSVVEPRYVLELARLLEKTGDRSSALKEYERFLDFWKQADPGLPELAEARRAVARLR